MIYTILLLSQLPLAELNSDKAAIREQASHYIVNNSSVEEIELALKKPQTPEVRYRLKSALTTINYLKDERMAAQCIYLKKPDNMPGLEEFLEVNGDNKVSIECYGILYRDPVIRQFIKKVVNSKQPRVDITEFYDDSIITKQKWGNIAAVRFLSIKYNAKDVLETLPRPEDRRYVYCDCSYCVSKLFHVPDDYWYQTYGVQKNED